MRGRTWCRYVTDDGAPYALEVDSDYALQPGRGWSTSSVVGLAPLPRGWQPRRVVGQDIEGRLVTARIGNTNAPLWLGTEMTFDFEKDDLTMGTATVLHRLGERTSRRPT